MTTATLERTGGTASAPSVTAEAAPSSFVDYVLERLPKPPSPITGKVEPGHLELHGRQREFLRDPYRFKAFCAGWRGGKSFASALAILVDLQWAKRRGHDGLIWTVVGPDYQQAEPEMNHLHWMLEKLGLAHTFKQPENGSWQIRFPDNDYLIWTRTSAQVSKLAGLAYRGVVVAEAAQHPESVMTQLRGRIAENRGWVILSGTFEYETGPWYGMLADEWAEGQGSGVAYFCPSWDNRAVFPGGRDDPEIQQHEREMAPEVFMETFGGRPRRSSHLVMKYAERKHHIAQRFPALESSYDRESPVTLWIDPGRAHAFAVMAVQFEMNVCWVIDAVYRWGRTVPMMVEECARKPWAVNVSEVVMDPASQQRRTEHPMSVREQWELLWSERLGRRPHVVLPPTPLAEGYEAHHRALWNAWPPDAANEKWNRDEAVRPELITNPHGPRLYFDPKAAAPLFGGTVDGRPWAGEYHLHKNRVDRGGTILRDEPVDTNNDAIKAINYGLYYRFNVRDTAVPMMPYSMPYRMEF